MDSAYDHIAEETLSGDRAPTPTPPQAGPSSTTTASATRPNLNTEFQETLRAFSHSPWGATLGGLWGNVRKQGESYYEGARREVGEAGGEALKGFTDLRDSLVSRTRSLSLGEADNAKANLSTSNGGASTPTASDAQEGEGEGEGLIKERTESEILQENDSLIARFRSEAAKRLKDIEKAEDAADEALLRFGTNIRNFLRDAVAIAPPSEDTTATQSGGDFLFESKDASGKRAIHTTRFDAQLHVIHITLDSFTQDPVSDEWPTFKKELMIDQKTDDISRDLETYPELRHTMEQLVPEKVEYMDFWCRYYFLRMIVDTQEKERKELLKGASSQNADEEVGWDEDSEDEQSPPTPQGKQANPTVITMEDNDSAAALQQPPPSVVEPLKPEARRSHDRQSQPDSDASYDLVSGATSRAPGSPKDEKPKDIEATKDEETDEEDWE